MSAVRGVDEGAVGALEDELGALEVEELRVLPQVRRLRLGLGPRGDVRVDEHHGGVVPHHALAVGHGGQHVRLVVPHHALHHAGHLAWRGLVHRGDVHVAVPVEEDQLPALDAARRLVQRHLDNVRAVTQRFRGGTAARHVEQVDHLGVRLVLQSEDVVAERHGLQVQELGS